jgi:poly(3-hydroxybutyrate) depolymerase
MYEPVGPPFPQLAFLWPALAAASVGEIAEAMAKQFIDLAVGPENGPLQKEPNWATPNTIALELKTVRLRNFATSCEGGPTLVCAPFALHAAAVVDLAPGHSLIAALSDAGLQRVFVAEWRSADADMRFLGIDDYLATLNVLVDQLGGTVDLIGLCQGGWIALLYAARFPAKVRKLVLAGAPIDIAAEPSALSAVADASPLGLFYELVKLGDGRILGHKVSKFWGPQSLNSSDVHQTLQTVEPADPSACARVEALFRDWHAWTVDLPGTYFLEVTEKLYKHNELAKGTFVALGKKVDLTTVRVPIFLLAARDDELVAPGQLFATERLVGTPAHQVCKEIAPGRHLGLFMGKAILNEFWPRIVRWLLEPVYNRSPGFSRPAHKAALSMGGAARRA